ncbi:MAG TPA: hypothetical protein DF294_05215 [Psychrobacter sp.]|nr:hypothetical protein [Psychrobacter sp.]
MQYLHIFYVGLTIDKHSWQTKGKANIIVVLYEKMLFAINNFKQNKTKPAIAARGAACIGITLANPNACRPLPQYFLP